MAIWLDLAPAEAYISYENILKPIFHVAFSFHRIGNQANTNEMYMQRKYFYLYSAWILFVNEIDLGICYMVWEKLLRNVIPFWAEKIFEIYYVGCPQRDQRTPSGI